MYVGSMGASAKLERLRLSWIGYGVFIAIVGLFRDGIYSQSLIDAAIRIGVTFAFARFLTKQLDQKSSLTWAFGVVFGLIGAVTAGIEVIGTIVDATDGHGFELGTFLLSAASVVIHVQTFRLLRDSEIKRHVMLD